jgi:hypothetical protein
VQLFHSCCVLDDVGWLPVLRCCRPAVLLQLAKTLGVVKLIVVVNKLDDHSVVGPDGQWDQNRWVRCGLGKPSRVWHIYWSRGG